MPKFYNRVCNTCSKGYYGRGKYYCSNKCASKIENKKRAEKISISMAGKKNRLGTKQPESFKKLKRLQFLKNNPVYNPQTIIKIKESLKKRWDLIGRKSKRIRNTDYLLWRSFVFERDNYTCQSCNQSGCYIEAHHIKSWIKYPKLRLEISNGLTLCKKCHKETDNYGNKKN